MQALSLTEHSVDTSNGLETTLPLTEVTETNEKDKEAKEEASGERETRMDEEMGMWNNRGMSLICTYKYMYYFLKCYICMLA